MLCPAKQPDGARDAIDRARSMRRHRAGVLSNDNGTRKARLQNNHFTRLPLNCGSPIRQLGSVLDAGRQWPRRVAGSAWADMGLGRKMGVRAARLALCMAVFRCALALVFAMALTIAMPARSFAQVVGGDGGSHVDGAGGGGGGFGGGSGGSGGVSGGGDGGNGGNGT